MIKLFENVIILSVFFILVVSLMKQNKRNGRKISSYSGIVFAFILYYTVIPLIILNSSQIDKSKRTIRFILSTNTVNFVSAEIAILLFFAFFTYTYRRQNNNRLVIKYQFDKGKWINISKIVTWFTFVIGGITFIIYIRAFGGVSNLLSQAEYMRSFATSGTEFMSYSSSIMVIPARLITVTPLSVLALMNKRVKNYLLYRGIFIISMLLTLIFVMSNAGKTAIITWLLIFIVPIIGKFTKHPWIIAIALGIAMIPFLGVLDAFFVYLQDGNWSYTSQDFLSYIYSFTYPWTNILNMENIVQEFGMRWGKDFITGFLNIIPGLTFEAAYEPVSFFYGGENWKITGGTPLDIITFGYMQLRIIGVIGVAILLGSVLGKLDRILRQFRNDYVGKVVVTSIAVNFFSFAVNADVSSVIRGQFQLIFMCICVIYSCRKKKGSR